MVGKPHWCQVLEGNSVGDSEPAAQLAGPLTPNSPACCLRTACLIWWAKSHIGVLTTRPGKKSLSAQLIVANARTSGLSSASQPAGPVAALTGPRRRTDLAHTAHGANCAVREVAWPATSASTGAANVAGSFVPMGGAAWMPSYRRSCTGCRLPMQAAHAQSLAKHPEPCV
eukprot:s4045_g1.t1